MATRERRIYTEQFKADSVELAIQSEKSVRQIARDLRVESGLLHTWIRERGKRSGDVTPAAETLADEVRRLRREVTDLKDERDFLKKATAYFAKENE